MLYRHARSCTREYHTDCSKVSKDWTSHFQSSTFPSDVPTKISILQLKMNSYCIIFFSIMFPITSRKRPLTLRGKTQQRSFGIGLGKELQSSSFMSCARPRKCRKTKNDINKATERTNVYYRHLWVTTIYKILCASLHNDGIPQSHHRLWRDKAWWGQSHAASRGRPWGWNCGHHTLT